MDFKRIFVSKILNIYTLEIGISDNGGIIYHYQYFFYLTSRKFVSEIIIRNPDACDLETLILNSWFNNVCKIKNQIEVVNRHIEANNLEAFIKICILLNVLSFKLDLSKAIELTKFYKKIPNLTLDEYIQEYYRYNNSFYYCDDLHRFKILIKKLNNNKISPLWWIWRDFSGEYNNYIEWLPRETLEDFLEVKCKGINQPDYNTFIK